MRIRTVKPEFHQSETLGKVSREVRYLACALLNWADDEGYFVTNPRVIAGSLLPLDDDGPAFVERALPELERIGYLVLFEGHVGLIPGLPTHQRINRPTKSKLKAKALKPLSLTEDSVSPHTQLSEASPTEGKGREGNRERKGTGKGNGSAEVAVSPKQVELPAEVVPAKQRRPPGLVEQVHEYFLEARGYRLEDLSLDVAAHPDEPPEWPRSAATVAAWAAAAKADDEPRTQLSYAKSVVDEFLKDPFWAGAKKRVDGKDTDEPQPYPWRALLSEKVWRRHVEAVERAWGAAA